MKKRHKPSNESKALLASMQEIRSRIDIVNQLFDTTTDELLLDACVYELKMLRLRYAYLVRLAREESHAVSEPRSEEILVPIPT